MQQISTSIHVRFEGRSLDLQPGHLGLDGLSQARALRDDQLFERLARYLEVPRDRLRGYVIDRPQTGHLIVRPEAVYG